MNAHLVIKDFYAHFKTFPEKQQKNSKTYIRVFTTFITLNKLVWLRGHGEAIEQPFQFKIELLLNIWP